MTVARSTAAPAAPGAAAAAGVPAASVQAAATPTRRAATGRRTPPAAREAAATLPVARVAVDVSLSHLDRPFDYLVDRDQDLDAVPGARVRVRFAGRLVDGFLLDRSDRSDHAGRLGFLERVVSAESVLAPEIRTLARAVADRYAGTLADVLRLAVPPRHARVESARPGPDPDTSDAAAPTADREPGGWARYAAGPAFLASVRVGRPARAVWQALPGEDWAARFADAAAAAHAAGRGALLLVPDATDLELLGTALAERLPAGSHTSLSADLGPPERYRRFLAVRRGAVRVVAGTRAAAFAPVADLGLVALFDDGDDLYAEPRAPYPHAREVLMLRSSLQRVPLLLGGWARTAEAALLVRSGWAREVVAPRAVLREAAPRIEAAGDRYAAGAESAAARARLSPAAFDAARRAFDAGAPALVQVPRQGYLPGLACARCLRPSRCRRCHGPLAVSGRDRPPSCRWCGVSDAHVVCGACGGDRLRTTTVGARRTAEELGRAFPGVPVLTSSGDEERPVVPDGPALVVATPGTEPAAPAGYGAALLLDGGLLLGRPDLRAAEEALRRWMGAAALVRPAAAGGRVVVGADTSLPAVQALIRWDPAGHADAELDARAELGFPPAVAMASVEGPESAVQAAAHELLELAARAAARPPELLGPVPLADLPGRVRGTPEPSAARLLVRVPQADRKGLTAALAALAADRSARRDAVALRVQVDPDALF
ncbi:primosome assembly protein PriA [Nakamurella endophytica]|uniref:Probable replication restart protein PriA n=1 Tax=Nakamurella endophytica TaxID=1748367 RepID=A0A917WG68_9ACTN|nr:primosome assembly protein PriA [Nakamurella endophytica]GGM01245.1 putative primosomal protein N' [Nakamurella endophytica]